MKALPLLVARDLRKEYRTEKVAVHALRGVSLDVSRGEYMAIMGPSGSGKTTLLDILGCLAQPTAGTYHVAGRPVHEMTDRELARLRNRDLGFVFQQYNLLPRASVLDNVMLPLTYGRVPAAEREARAIHVLEQVGLGARLDHLPNELSGGQMQRVAIARALVTEPLVILADEPTGNLDSAASTEILALFDAVHAAGNTLVVVTHDPEVATHASRVLLIRDGLVVSDERRRDPVAATAPHHAG